MKISDSILFKATNDDLRHGVFICPQEITCIGNEAFIFLDNLTAIYLSQNTKPESYMTFLNCKRLRVVIIDTEDDLYIQNFLITWFSPHSRVRVIKKSDCIDWLLTVQKGLGFAGLNQDIIRLIAKKASSKGLSFFSEWNLYTAAEEGKAGIIPRLAKEGADLNRSNTSFPELIPVCIASYYGHAHIIKELHDNKARLEIMNNHGLTALHYAAREGHAHVIAVLAQYGIDINMPTGYLSTKITTAIFLASENGHVNTIHELVKNEADINISMPHGATPLFIAAQNNHIAAVDALLKLGADNSLSFRTCADSLRCFAKSRGDQVISRMDTFINQQPYHTEIKMTPCGIARVMGNEEIVELLEQFHFSPNSSLRIQ